MFNALRRIAQGLRIGLPLVAVIYALSAPAADSGPLWPSFPSRSVANDQNAAGACVEVPTSALQSPSARAALEPLVLIGRRSFHCVCGARTLVGAQEGAKLVGGSEGAHLVGGDEGAKLVGGDEGAKLVGANEGAKLVGANEGSKLVGADEGAKLVGAKEAAKLVGGDEGAKLVGGDERAKLVGAETQVMCRQAIGCAGFSLLGLTDNLDVRVQAGGKISRASTTCVSW